MNSHDSITPRSNNLPIKLHSEYQVALTEELLDVVMTEYDFDIVNWQEAKHGIGHTVIQLENADRNYYYAKFYNSLHSRRRVENEVSFMKDAATQGLPVPNFCPTVNNEFISSYTDLAGDHAFTLSPAIKGDHPSHYTNVIITELASHHAKLHLLQNKLKINALDIITDYTYFDIKSMDGELQNITPLVNEAYTKTLNAWDTLPSGPVHLDIARSNVLTEDGQVSAILDFEDLSHAPFAFCLAGTLWDIYESSDGDLSKVALYSETYREKRDLNLAELALLNNLIFIRGWIALHGTLATQGIFSPLALTQQQLLCNLATQSP